MIRLHAYYAYCFLLQCTLQCCVVCMTNSRILNLQGHRRRSHDAERTDLQISLPDPIEFSYGTWCPRNKIKLYLKISLFILIKMEEN